MFDCFALAVSTDDPLLATRGINHSQCAVILYTSYLSLKLLKVSEHLLLYSFSFDVKAREMLSDKLISF